MQLRWPALVVPHGHRRAAMVGGIIAPANAGSTNPAKAGTRTDLSFVTLAGDLLQADGTLVVGPRSASGSPAGHHEVVGGLISRRSQLRELNDQLAALDSRIASAEAAVNEMQAAIAARQEELNGHAAAHRQATEALAEHRVRLTTAEERRAQFQQQRAAQEGELRAASVQHDAAVARLAESRQRRSARHGPGRDGNPAHRLAAADRPARR